MENLNAEQVIDNIEYCIEGECENCPYDEETSCREYLLHDALALINSQEQRIKELEEEYESMAKSVNKASELIRKLKADKEELTAKNERLRTENETLKMATNDQYAHLCDCHDNIAEMLRQKEAYTVMKMHSMLCEGRVSNDNVVIVANQVAKEMLEGENEKTHSN